MEGYSLRRGDAPTEYSIGVSITVIMVWGLWKSLASALLYIDVSVRPSSEALFFFGHLLSRFHLLEAPTVRQTPSTVVSSPIDLSDALEAFLECDVYRHHAPLGQLPLSLSTITWEILISLRQSEIIARR